MMMARTEKFEVELGGQIVPLIYMHGTLDKDKRDHLVQGSKTRYYYQCSQPTRGILLAASHTDSLNEMVRILNALPTPCFPDGRPSAPYNFSLSTHREKQLL